MIQLLPTCNPCRLASSAAATALSCMSSSSATRLVIAAKRRATGHRGVCQEERYLWVHGKDEQETSRKAQTMGGLGNELDNGWV